MVRRTPPKAPKTVPLQKFFKGDKATVISDVIVRDGPTLYAGDGVVIIDVEQVGHSYYYLVERGGDTSVVMELELK